MNLVDWFKGMVASHRGEELVDPLIEIPPPPRTLKRVLLVCFRCIDLDASKRPKMGQIVHMLEADDFSYRVVSFITFVCFVVQLNVLQLFDATFLVFSWHSVLIHCVSLLVYAVSI